MKLRTWFATLLIAAMLSLVACGGFGSDDDSDELALSRGDSGGAAGSVALAQESTGNFYAAATATAASGSRLTVGAPVSSGDTPGGAQPQSGNTGGDQDGGLDPVSLQQTTSSRQIIRVSSMVVVVENVSLATQQAQTEIAGLGGLIFGQDTTTSPRPRTTLTFKVMPEDFNEALSRLAGLGELETQQISADDVTDRVVDLESRIITNEASVTRLRGFLENATDLETVASLERELLSRETSLELLRGQLRTIQDQVGLATIFLTLIEPEPPVDHASIELVQTAYLGTDEGARCPDDDELTIDEGEAFTICISVENTGNLALTDIEIRDNSLDLDDRDFVVLEGSLESLEPEQRLVGYFEATANPGHFTNPTFSAVAVDEDGDPIRVPIEVKHELVDFDVIEDTSLPSFIDGLTGSLAALFVLAQVGVLALGVFLPFIWVPILAIGGIGLARRRMPRRQRTVRVERTETLDERSESDED
ncbi:MAG: DUF4349 domain-containing protein [Dehalococcoidia bacterium]|jgi:hypothetical protein|nr:DUF4349 domain-containing protein [Dehalococcoidia bacterium]